LRPFNGSWKIDALSHLQFTCEGSIGDEHENFSSTAAPGTGFTMRTPATVPWLAFNNATATATAGNDVQLDGLRTRFAPSVSYFGGPVGLAYQYYYERQEMQLNTTGRGSTIVYGVPLTGYDLLGSVLLTGETRTSYTQPLNILHPFDPLQGTGYGAVELAARVSRAAYDPIIFEPFVVGGTAKKPLTQSFANPIGNTSGATEMTLGINWYWNRYVKFQFNYEYDWFDQPVSLGSGPNNVVRQNSALLGRVALVY
jgi:phosphate-selective porin OprO/OprP